MRFNMKNIKRLLIVCTTLFIFVSGCSEKDYGFDKDNPITITLWHYYTSSQKVSFDKLVQEFNTTLGKEKGIQLEAKSQSSIGNLTTALNNSAQKKVGADEMPDMFSSYADTAMEIDKLYGLVDIKDYMSKEEADEYVDSYMEESNVNGNERTLIFPIAKATELLFLNKTAWEPFASSTQASLDDLKTWEGLQKTAQAYYTYSNGKAFFARDSVANYVLAGTTQLGHELFAVDKQGVPTATVDETTMRTLWDNYYIPFVKGYYLKNGKYATDDLKTNDVIALVGSSSGAAFFPSTISTGENETQDIEAVVLPVPNFEGKDPIAVQQGAGIAISKSDEMREYACTVFLKWFSESSRNTAFAANASYLPVKKDANDPQKLQATLEQEGTQIKPLVFDSLEVAMKQIQDSELYYSTPFTNSNEARDYVQSALQDKASHDREKVEEAISAGNSYEEALKSYTSEENFKAWYQDFTTKLQEIVANEA